MKERSVTKICTEAAFNVTFENCWGVCSFFFRWQTAHILAYSFLRQLSSGTLYISCFQGIKAHTWSVFQKEKQDTVKEKIVLVVILKINLYCNDIDQLCHINDRADLLEAYLCFNGELHYVKNQEKVES